MTVIITLTTAGSDTGPFNLFSDADGYTIPFATGITRQQLLDGYPSAAVPSSTIIIKVQSLNSLCTNFILLNIPTTTTTTSSSSTTTTTTTTAAPTYCVSWTAANEGNIKMSTEGYIDFTAILAGRTIVGGLSAGTITGYVISGMSPFTCSIPMTFTTSRAEWNTDTLPVETDKVLTSLIYTVEVIFNNSDEYFINDEQTNAIVIPGQLTSSFDNCPVITTTTTTTFSGLCYSYELQTVDTSETATWTTCDGNSEIYELGINDTYIIDCAREGSVVFNGPTTQSEATCNTPLTSILLANSNVSGNDACNNYATIPSSWFISGSTEFADASKIFEDQYGFQVAVSAIYSNGVIYRYWDGFTLDTPTGCTI